MNVTSIKSIKKEKIKNPLFTNHVYLQSPFLDVEDCDLWVSYVHFPKDTANKFHTHSTDQILIVTEGHGFVATEDKTTEVKKGDIIRIPAGQIHKHGALSKQKFTHISILRSKSKLKQVEK